MMEYLYSIFGGSKSIPWINAVFIFMTTMVIGWLVRRFLEIVMRRLVSRTETSLDDAILAIILPRIQWIALLTAVYLSVREISGAITAINKSASQWIIYANSTLMVTTAVMVTTIVIQTINVTLEHLMLRRAQRTSTDVNRGLFLLLKRMINIIGVLIAMIIVFERFGISASSLLVFLGGSSVAIALAAQDTLSNMIAGFVIMLDRPFRVGDRIKLPTGEVGDVYEIGVRSTKILDFDANMIISPNAELIKAKVVNYAYPAKAIRVLVSVVVAYNSDIDAAKKILLGLAKKRPDILRDPAPEVFVTNLGENGITLELHARTSEYAAKWVAETSIREQLLKAFSENGIVIPYPTRNIRVVNGKLPRRSKRSSV